MATLGWWRNVAGFSRADLAAALDVDLFTVARYEGCDPIPDEHAAILGQALGVAPEIVQRGDEIVREAILREAPEGWL
jgi:ribosome-binding protein aMBF1 (putative translation factor)